MSATEFRLRRGGRRRGSVLVVVTFATIAIAGLSFAMLQGSTTLYRGARARVESAKSFYVTEGGLDWTMSQLSNDPYLAAHDATSFPTANADGSFETDWMPLGQNAGDFKATVTYAHVNSVPASWTGTGLPPDFTPFAPIAIADRTTSPDFERFMVSVTGRYNGTERACRAILKAEFKAYGAALVCDAAPNDAPAGDTGLALASDGQAIVLSGNNQYLFGGVATNGALYKNDAAHEVTADNVATQMPNVKGTLATELYGSDTELPDYTAPGMAQQLFDFGLFRDAAMAGKGSYYANLTAFGTAMNAANAAHQPLQGIVFVAVDANVAGSRALISSSSTLGAGLTGASIPGGINVDGTLVFHVTNAPSDHYRFSVETPLHVNPATLGSTFNPADSHTFSSGYPAAISAAMDPHTYTGFKAGDDLPAVMIDNGTLEILREANVCGAVYAPALMRIENTQDERQFFDGALIAGAGIYVEGSTTSAGSQTVAFDPFSIDDLATFGNMGKAPILAGYVIDK